MKHSTRKIDITDDFGGYNADNFCNVGAAIIGGSVISGVMGSNAARGAASTQADAARAAAEAQLTATRETNAMQQKMYDANVARMNPFVQAGMGSLGQLQAGLAPGGQFTKTFGPGDLQLDPGYQFRLQQGTQNLNASAAARGMLGSGQNLKDVTDYGQGAASQEYQNAFNRYQTNQSNLYNRLAGMAQMSQNSAAGIGSQGMQVAQNMAQNTMAGTSAANNYLTSGAAASAAGQMGSANAIGNAFNTGMGNWMGMQYLNRMQPQATTGGFTVPGTPTPGAGIDVSSIQG